MHHSALKFSFSEKATKMCAIVLMEFGFGLPRKAKSKKKSLVRFLGESTARQSAFGFIWPLVDVKTIRTIVLIFVAFSEKLNFKSQKFSHSRFSVVEMKRIYRGFKTECPTGLITEEAFHGIYSRFFPQGGTGDF